MIIAYPSGYTKRGIENVLADLGCSDDSCHSLYAP
jgi:hypothetical protein